MISQADQLVYGVCLFGGGTVDALHPAQTEGDDVGSLSNYNRAYGNPNVLLFLLLWG